MLPFEDLVRGNPSTEMMKQVVVTAKKRPEFPEAFNLETVSVFHHSLWNTIVFLSCVLLTYYYNIF